MGSIADVFGKAVFVFAVVSFACLSVWIAAKRRPGPDVRLPVLFLFAGTVAATLYNVVPLSRDAKLVMDCVGMLLTVVAVVAGLRALVKSSSRNASQRQ